MTRRLPLVILLAWTAGAAASETPRHLVLIAIDTLRADRLGCYGHERPTSPAMDAVAERGMLFEEAISTAPWTLPSFASVFTGRVPTRHGAVLHGELRRLGDDVPSPLSPDIPTLTGQLAARGFRCAAFTTNPYLRLGLQRDFEEFWCRTVSAPQVGALARAWIAGADPDQPNFLFVHFNDPHEPTNPADPYLAAIGVELGGDPRRSSLERWGEGESMLGRATDVASVESALELKLALYDGAIRRVDQEISRILRALEERGMLRESLVVVTSDHGEEFLEHLQPERAAAEDPRGLFGIGHGHTLYDELLHVPLLLMGPGIDAGTRVGEQFSLVDLMPTLLGMLGVEAPTGMDGQDRGDWIRSPRRESPAVYAESIAYGVDRVALRLPGAKLILDRLGQHFAYFDLSRDPGELAPSAQTPEALRLQLIQSVGAWAADAPPRLDPALLDPSMLEGLRALGYAQ